MRSSQPRIVRHALGVVDVVHRIGLRHAHGVAAHDLRRARQAELLELAGGELDQVLVVHAPQLVALEAEVLEADARGARVGHHPRAPGPVVLDAADLARWARGCRSSCRGRGPRRRARARPSGSRGSAARARPRRRRRAPPGRTSPTTLRRGSDEITVSAVERLAADDDLGDAAVAARCAGPRPGDSSSTSPPSDADALGHLLPHLAGAVAGVVELLDQRLDLLVAVAEEGVARGATRTTGP